MSRILKQSLSIPLVWAFSTLIQPRMAYAIESIPNPTTPPANAAENPEQSAALGSFVSNGTPVQFQDIGIVMTPPMGWEVDAGKGNGMSVIISEPKVNLKNVATEVTTYQRNITVTVKHEAAPIDEKTAADLAEGLKRDFGKSSMVRDFDILETKLIDYTPTAKAVLVYSSMRLGDVGMMQMHILVSGGDKQYLQTYTDMASRFSTTDSGFTQAWAAMTGLTAKGKAPTRYGSLMVYGGASGAVIVGFGLFLIINSRRRKKAFRNSVMAMESSEHSSNESTVSHMVSQHWAQASDESDDSDVCEDAVSSARDLPVTAINGTIQSWHSSSEITAAKPAKIRLKAVVNGGVSDESTSGDEDSTDWVLPVKTRITTARVSFG